MPQGGEERQAAMTAGREGDEKAARLAEALRRNLRRRKAQQRLARRERRDGAGGVAGGDAGGYKQPGDAPPEDDGPAASSPQ